MKFKDFHFFSRFRQLTCLLFFLFSASIIAGCIGGGGGGEGGSADSSSGGSSSGSSGGSSGGIFIGGTGLDGPVIFGAINFFNDDESLCEETSTNENSFYDVIIPFSCNYPLTIELAGGIDTSSERTNTTTLYSLVSDQSFSTVNINPYTTLIYHAALARTTDGTMQSIITEQVDLNGIAEDVIRKFNFGIDAENPAFNPLTSPVSIDNVASYLKANEGLIECVRRTAKLVSTDGEADRNTINMILSSLGADISDGTLDGEINNFSQQEYSVLGLDGKRLVALWETNVLEVALEVMTNQLKITYTKEQKEEIADEQGIPIGSVDPTVPPETVANNLAAAIEYMAQSIGGFITREEAKQRLEQIGITAKFIYQIQAAIASELSIATAKGFSTNELIALQNIFNTFESSIDLKNELRLTYDQIKPALDQLATSIVSIAKNNDPADENIFENAIIGAITEIYTSEAIIKNVREILATWNYSASNPEKFRLYQKTTSGDQLICETPGTIRSSEFADCFVNFTGNPISFYLTAYTAGYESEPSPTVTYDNQIPIAKFQATLIKGEPPLTVDFDADKSYDPDGSITEYNWNFGDGSYGSGPQVTNTYSNQGTYNVFLKVTDNHSTSHSTSATAEAYLTIEVGTDSSGAPSGSIFAVTLLDKINYGDDLSASTKKANNSRANVNTTSPQKNVLQQSQHNYNMPISEQKQLVMLSSNQEESHTSTSFGIEKDTDIKIYAFIISWLRAWEDTAGTKGDMGKYMSHYSDKFTSGNLDKNGWNRDKADKNKRKSWIHITLKNIEIEEFQKGKIKISFLQEFSSSNYSDKSKKYLVLDKENNEWKILAESAEKN